MQQMTQPGDNVIKLRAGSVIKLGHSQVLTLTNEIKMLNATIGDTMIIKVIQNNGQRYVRITKATEEPQS